MAAAIKMDELLVSWLARDDVYESVMEWIDNYSAAKAKNAAANNSDTTSLEQRVAHMSLEPNETRNDTESETTMDDDNTTSTGGGGRNMVASADTIPPFYPVGQQYPRRRIIRNNKDKTKSTTDNESSSSSTPNDGTSTNPIVATAAATGKKSAVTKNVSPTTILSQYDTWDPPTTISDNETQQQGNKSPNATANATKGRSTKDTDGAARSSGSNVGTAGSSDTNDGTYENDDEYQHQLLSQSRTITGTSSTDASDDDDTTAMRGADAALQPSPSSMLLGTPYSCARDCAAAIYSEIFGSSFSPSSTNNPTKANSLLLDQFVRITKDVCRFPSYFNSSLYIRIIELWNKYQHDNDPNATAVTEDDGITITMLEWFFRTEMEPYDAYDRFFRLVRQPANQNYIVRDDFQPYIKALLSDHPGLEFLSSHAEFQEKYAITVITRIFYSVNRCHSGRITSRQVRRSDLLEAFTQVDEEEDINKVTRYFSYEHFYVLYCRFWELDHDRDYRITREDLLKYGDHSLSHMIVDRIFDAAPRPFFADQQQKQKELLPPAIGNELATTGPKTSPRDYLSYEDFIYFMLSEEDKSNEVAVRYWFTCVDVDGDNKLNNMEMRSFYAVQLHRMQCTGHEIVPFDDMLCQMMDMIKPANTDYLVVEDFLQMECCQVSGALFDALFNLNKYLLFEQRDPFVERQKREDEFECDWDRFACIDYNRLAMEEEAREEEAMEIDWVTVDDEEEEEAAAAAGTGGGAGASDSGNALDMDGIVSSQQQSSSKESSF